MIVDAGISGQKVIEQTYDKIRKLVKIREEKGLDFLIEADGSMNRDVYRPLYEAGADMVVLGPPALWIRLMTSKKHGLSWKMSLKASLIKQREEKTNVKQKRKYRSKTRPSAKLWLAY